MRECQVQVGKDRQSIQEISCPKIGFEHEVYLAVEPLVPAPIQVEVEVDAETRATY
jgi:hypothetical protein